MEQFPKGNLNDELMQLSMLIAILPPEHRQPLQDAFEKVMDSANRRKRIIELVQEALDQLRLDIKYLMFDLDATRKERDTLQRRLDDSESG